MIVGARNAKILYFYLGTNVIETDKSYIYLGLYISNNGNFAYAKQYTANKANKTMH